MTRQNFNYHTHTFRSGHSLYVNDEEMVKASIDAGIKTLGFTEHIPNTLYEEHIANRLLNCEVNDYISSINKLKEKYDILIGFEAEYNPLKEYHLKQMRNRVDYMILGQHYICDGLNVINGEKQVDYPLYYAQSVCDALDSGLYDIVAHPDIFLKYKGYFDGKLKDIYIENVIKASKQIANKASQLGVPLEINFGNINAGRKEFIYPNKLFWESIKDIDNLKVIYGIDAHSPYAFKNLDIYYDKVKEITDLVSNKLLYDYNPLTDRNVLLNELYNLRNINKRYEDYLNSLSNLSEINYKVKYCRSRIDVLRYEIEYIKCEYDIDTFENRMKLLKKNNSIEELTNIIDNLCDLSLKLI